jgi:DNA-binding NarL/FixJ family response regulator
VSSILVIDSDAAFCARLSRILRQRGKVASMRSVDAISPQAYPQLKVIVLGVDFDAGDINPQICRIKLALPAPSILLAAERTSPEPLEKALRAGALGCLLKSDPDVEWEEAIANSTAGKLFVSNSIVPALLKHVLNSTPAQTVSGLEGLTDRELIIFQMIGSGLRIYEIAANLKLSSKTIECHREKIKHRLGLANSAELLHCACDWMNRDRQITPVAASAGT